MKKVTLIFILFLFLYGCNGSQENNSATIVSDAPKTYEGELTLDFSFGTRTGVYSGEVDDSGLPNGKGIFTSNNSEDETWTYEGDWIAGHWEGHGTSTWSSGQKYVGEFSNDVEKGNGRLDLPDGTHFEGEFVDISNAIGFITKGDKCFYAKISNGILDIGGIWRTGKFGDEIDIFQGEWQSLDSKYSRAVISGESINLVSEYDIGSKNYRNVFTYYFDFNDNHELIVVNESNTPRYEIAISEDGILSLTSENKNEFYEKISSNIEVPTERGDPKIGMSESEVYASAWGHPQKKNKTTTASGTHEQWVYKDGYIYLENGIVTAIQD